MVHSISLTDDYSESVTVSYTYNADNEFVRKFRITEAQILLRDYWGINFSLSVRAFFTR